MTPVAMQVGAADPRELDVEHDLAVDGLRLGRVLVVDPPVAVPDERFHRMTAKCPLVAVSSCASCRFRRLAVALHTITSTSTRTPSNRLDLDPQPARKGHPH